MPRRRRPARPGALADLAPRRILTQIVLLQLLYYAVAGALILFTTIVAGQPVDFGLVFGWDRVRGDVTTGWTLALCWMFSSLISVIFLLLLIARSKLVADFALTIHFLHFLIVSFYARSVPRNVFWWELQAASAALMTGLGMWACQWRELKPITFGGGRASTGTAGGAVAATDAETGAAAGLLNGASAGGRGDAAGVYEMIGMKSKDGNG